MRVLTGAVDGAHGGGGHGSPLLGTGYAELAYGWGAAGLTGRGRPRLSGGYQRHEALAVLVAGRAALQGGARMPGTAASAVGAGQRELDVAIDLVEARLTGQLGLRRA